MGILYLLLSLDVIKLMVHLIAMKVTVVNSENGQNKENYPGKANRELKWTPVGGRWSNMSYELTICVAEPK